jgi:NAD(P)-dependent dehydrogenase (short-subunit alcohol dehydrogenase family)
MVNFGFETTGEEAASALSSHIQGKTIIITGVSPKSLGYETARVIALQKPKLLVLAGRSSSKLQQVEKDLKEAAPGVSIRQLILDLGSQAAVRKAAEEVNGWKDVPTIDVLLNNAGIMAQPFSLTPEGIESQFGTNHIGHFLFTQLIIGKVLAASEGKRVVNLSSNAYAMGRVRFEDINFQKGEYNSWESYAQSKSANVLYSKALAQKYKSKGLVAFSVHPGAIWTNLGLHAKDDLKAFGRSHSTIMYYNGC